MGDVRLMICFARWRSGRLSLRDPAPAHVLLILESSSLAKRDETKVGQSVSQSVRVDEFQSNPARSN